MKATSNEDIENNTTLSIVDKMELNAVDNAKNITELNTVQNVILNNTNIGYNFTDYDEQKEYVVMKELHKRYRHRLFIAQITIQTVVIAIILVIVIIVIIKSKYIK